MSVPTDQAGMKVSTLICVMRRHGMSHLLNTQSHIMIIIQDEVTREMKIAVSRPVVKL